MDAKWDAGILRYGIWDMGYGIIMGRVARVGMDVSVSIDEKE